MDMSGEHEIAAPRETVWAALNDPEVLKACIPGCQEIEKTSDTEFSARVKAKVGPVNATFAGNVSLSNINPPESYTISGEGSGGAAGFAKGGADVALEDHGESTKLTYKVHAQVGGKLAQLGQRLIQSTANKYAKQFFDTFKEQLEGSAAAESGAAGDSGGGAGATDLTGSASGPASQQPAADSEPATTASAGPAAGDGPGETTGGTESQPAQATQTTPPEPERDGIKPVYWIGGLIVLVLILLAIFGT
jgi:carbon monoxide dehydrogenase subunit G